MVRDNRSIPLDGCWGNRSIPLDGCWGIHEAGAGMGIICSDSDAEPAKSMGRLLRCLSFLHRHDQLRGTTNLDAEWPPQPDNPTPIPSSISLTPTRSPPGDRNLDDRHERCDHTAQQARTAYRTYADWEFGIHRPIPAGESCVSQHLRGIDAVVTCFSVEQVRGPLTTSGDRPENHQFRHQVSIVYSAGDRQAGRPW